MGFIGGIWGILFALPFRDLGEWPRNSAIAGAIEIVCSLRVVLEIIRGRIRRKGKWRGEHSEATDGSDATGRSQARPAEAARRSGDGL
jgi:hypothetical protein